MSSNLPPGVSDADIEAHAGGCEEPHWMDEDRTEIELSGQDIEDLDQALTHYMNWIRSIGDSPRLTELRLRINEFYKLGDKLSKAAQELDDRYHESIANNGTDETGD